jgi:hypothetical protein
MNLWPHWSIKCFINYKKLKLIKINYEKLQKIKINYKKLKLIIKN